ncbi:MAG TPA: 2Fe-2S iron-sulfur cluster-binding protein [Stenotrophomonas sp.]|nr:2Fe-2S iron-sulfur cluster-binding protein [Stenotrophomonas sp.]
MSHFYPLQVTERRQETRDAVVLTLAAPAQHTARFDFLPGQYLTVRARVGDESLRRAYSICSAPDEQVLRIAIKRVAGGRFSNWANDALQPGDVLESMRPAGRFQVPLLPDDARHHVAFAAGSGITAILSLLKATLAAEPRSHFTLVYGNRACATMMFRDELAQLKDRYLARFEPVYLLSREDQDITLFNGRLDRPKCDALLQHWLSGQRIDQAYICGPAGMAGEVTASLQAAGVAPARILTEHFAPATAPARPRTAAPDIRERDDDGDCQLSVVRDGQWQHLALRRDGGSVLEQALAQGVELPYACCGGVCSTCRCRLLEGEVDMADAPALEDYERDRGFILSCCSFPRSDRLVLDFDVEA